jgi:hypothetical protein
MAAWGVLLPLMPHLQNVVLDKPEVSFGRAHACDVSMPSMPTYSGRHATLSCRTGANGRVVILKNLSPNGTWLKKRGRHKPRKLAKNEEGELKPGDSFSLLLPPHAVAEKFKDQAVAFELEDAPPPANAATAAGAAAPAPAAAKPRTTQFKVPAPKSKSAPSSNSKATLHTAYDVSKRVLGSGQFATVFSCTSRQDGKTYACKNIQKKKFMFHTKFEQNIKKEVSILQKIKHPNIVQVVDVFETEAELNLIMEIMMGGELFEYIIDRGRLEEEISRDIVEQVLQAVEHLHTNDILHRDREADNCLPLLDVLTRSVLSHLRQG